MLKVFSRVDHCLSKTVLRCTLEGTEESTSEL